MLVQRLLVMSVALFLASCGDSNTLIGEWEVAKTIESTSAGQSKKIIFKEDLYYPTPSQAVAVKEYKVDGSNVVLQAENGRSLVFVVNDEDTISLSNVVYRRVGASDDLQTWQANKNAEIMCGKFDELLVSLKSPDDKSKATHKAVVEVCPTYYAKNSKMFSCIMQRQQRNAFMTKGMSCGFPILQWIAEGENISLK
jgi:hypothetical protein